MSEEKNEEKTTTTLKENLNKAGDKLKQTAEKVCTSTGEFIEKIKEERTIIPENRVDLQCMNYGYIYSERDRVAIPLTSITSLEVIEDEEENIPSYFEGEKEDSKYTIRLYIGEDKDSTFEHIDFGYFKEYNKELVETVHIMSKAIWC